MMDMFFPTGVKFLFTCISNIYKMALPANTFVDWTMRVSQRKLLRFCGKGLISELFTPSANYPSQNMTYIMISLVTTQALSKFLGGYC